MKLLLLLLWSLVGASAVLASDETLRRGIFGSYSRLTGMVATLIELRHDGSYVVTFQSCLSSEEGGKGRWWIKDEVLLLSESGDRGEKRDHPSRFEIVVADGDLALKPLETDESAAEPQLFRRQKTEANQALQPTRMLVTFHAYAWPAPSTRVADL